MKSEAVLWKSPPNKTNTGLVVNLNESFEKKYGINIFSNEVEKSSFTIVNPSDLEFSPQVQAFMKDEIPRMNSKVEDLYSNKKIPTVDTIESIPKINLTHPAASSSSTCSSSSKPSSYLDYKGALFGAKVSKVQPRELLFKNNLVTNNKSFYAFNPWILSGGCPNFAKNVSNVDSVNKKRSNEETYSKDSTMSKKRSISSADTELLQVTNIASDETTTEYVENNVQQLPTDETMATITNDDVFVHNLTPAEQLLQEIKEEIRRNEEVNKRIVDSIVGVGNSK